MKQVRVLSMYWQSRWFLTRVCVNTRQHQAIRRWFPLAYDEMWLVYSKASLMTVADLNPVHSHPLRPVTAYSLLD